MLRRQHPDRYRIERDDEEAVFDSDDAAIAHVRAAGARGDKICWLSYELHKAHAELDAAEIAMHSGRMRRSNSNSGRQRSKMKPLRRPAWAGKWLYTASGQVPKVVSVTETPAAGRMCRELSMGGSQQCGLSEWSGQWLPF